MTDSAYDIGTNSLRVANGYFDTLYGDGSNLTNLPAAGIASVVADTSPQLGGDLDTNSHNILLDDSHGVKFGAAEDLVILHDGDHSYINDNGTGNLYISVSSKLHVQNQAQNESIAIFNENGSCELYHNDSKKLETSSTGVDVTGNLTATGGSATLKVSESGGATGEVRAGGATVYFGTESNHEISFITNDTIRMKLTNGGNLHPHADNTYDLGTSSYRWRNVYTADLNLSNKGDSNDVDGTWGSYTIQEGLNSLFLINNRNGKKYKFDLTEVS